MRLLSAFGAALTGCGFLCAAPITYTFTGSASGTLGGVPFATKTITLSLSTDTTLLVDLQPPSCNLFCETPFVPNAPFTISGIGNGIFTQSSLVVLAAGAGGDILNFLAGTVPIASVQTSLLGPGNYGLGDNISAVLSSVSTAPVAQSVSTSLGNLQITSPVTYTFSAASSASTPEPGSGTVFITSLLTLLLLHRYVNLRKQHERRAHIHQIARVLEAENLMFLRQVFTRPVWRDPPRKLLR